MNNSHRWGPMVGFYRACACGAVKLCAMSGARYFHKRDRVWRKDSPWPCASNIREIPLVTVAETNALVDKAITLVREREAAR